MKWKINNRALTKNNSTSKENSFQDLKKDVILRGIKEVFYDDPKNAKLSRNTVQVIID